MKHCNEIATVELASIGNKVITHWSTENTEVILKRSQEVCHWNTGKVGMKKQGGES